MSKRLEGIEGLAPEDRWTMLWWGVERIDLRRALRWVQSLRHTIDVLTVTPTPEAGTVFWMRVSDRQTAPGPGDLPARGRDTLRGLSDRARALADRGDGRCRVDVRTSG